jgi:hypothetical protein
MTHSIDTNPIVAFIFWRLHSLISILIKLIGLPFHEMFGSDTKWYKFWVELTLENLLARRECSITYIHIVKIILNPFGTQGLKQVPSIILCFQAFQKILTRSKWSIHMVLLLRENFTYHLWYFITFTIMHINFKVSI